MNKCTNDDVEQDKDGLVHDLQCVYAIKWSKWFNKWLTKKCLTFFKSPH